MATARIAQIESARFFGPRARVLDLALVGEDCLGFVGGQYVIVDTGVSLPNGKRAKRAYSILSCDQEQRRFRLAVRKLEPGPGSSVLHALPEGSTVQFSGPWGKYVAPPAIHAPVLVFATDTGITAALGLVRGRAFTSLLEQRQEVQVVWYVSGGDGFVSVDYVREELGAAADRFAVEPALPVGHPERTEHARAAAFRHLDRTADTAFLSGDGDVIYPLRDALVSTGTNGDQICVEAFFNNPGRKAP
jgi:ferredoxin-NADP reductase